jgi:hypothetical protein
MSDYTPSIALCKRTNFVTNGRAEKMKGREKGRKKERKKEGRKKMDVVR